MSFKGTVKAFREDKGFGFISAEDGSEVFVHAAACVDGAQPQVGDQLAFDVEESKMKPGQMQACNVTGGSVQKGAGKGKGKIDTGAPQGTLKGEIKSFVRDPGYGFIVAEDGSDLFCHLHAVVDGTVPQKGDIVTYDVEPSKSKPGTMTACNVRGGSGWPSAIDLGGKGGKGGFGAAKGGDSWGGKGGPYGGDSWGGKGGDSWGGKGGDSWGGKGGKGMMEGMMQMMTSMMGGGGKGGGGWGGGGDSWGGKGDGWGGKGDGWGGKGDGWGGKGDGKGWGGKGGW